MARVTDKPFEGWKGVERLPVWAQWPLAALLSVALLALLWGFGPDWMDWVATIGVVALIAIGVVSTFRR